MGVIEKLGGIPKGRKLTALITFCGIAGLILIMLSSLFPEEKECEKVADISSESISAEEYCKETEEKLSKFLSSIEGAGEVKVYLTVSSNEKYVYAKEGKRSKSERGTEEEQKYVIVSNGSTKNPLVETVEAPEITGAVVACRGCGSPLVQERIYKAVSTALGLPTGRIYVTSLEKT